MKVVILINKELCNKYEIVQLRNKYPTLITYNLPLTTYLSSSSTLNILLTTGPVLPL